MFGGWETVGLVWSKALQIARARALVESVDVPKPPSGRATLTLIWGGPKNKDLLDIHFGSVLIGSRQLSESQLLLYFARVFFLARANELAEVGNGNAFGSHSISLCT